MNVVFMYPGQSSRYPACIEKLLEYDPLAGQVLEHAADILHRDLRREFRPDNLGIFASNQSIQVGIFLTNFIYGRLLARAGVVAAASLGQSLGEYNHLVEIGVLTFQAALRLVASRGALYDQGPAGVMAAVGPIEVEPLEAVLRRIDGPIAISNFNSPTQQVIAGSGAAVEAALAVVEAEHFVQGTIIEPNIAMHTPLFAEVGRRFRPILETAEWGQASKPYLPNVTASPANDPSRETIVALLTEHVYRPVLWRQSIERVAASYPEAIFVEVGARAILFNLLRRQWLPNRKLKVDADIDAPPAIEAVVAALELAGAAP
jgi:[acyl-carrier-protein] S-malonyltransferase